MQRQTDQMMTGMVLQRTVQDAFLVSLSLSVPQFFLLFFPVSFFLKSKTSVLAILFAFQTPFLYLLS